jgi:hypothetical protein
VRPPGENEIENSSEPAQTQGMNATLTIDPQGLLKLPDFMLERLHLRGGGSVVAEMKADGIMIKESSPVTEPRIVWKDGMRVIEGWDDFDAVQAVGDMREEQMTRLEARS